MPSPTIELDIYILNSVGNGQFSPMAMASDPDDSPFHLDRDKFAWQCVCVCECVSVHCRHTFGLRTHTVWESVSNSLFLTPHNFSLCILVGFLSFSFFFAVRFHAIVMQERSTVNNIRQKGKRNVHIMHRRM